MIVLAVKSYNGAPTDAVEASFDELGGTIGRADGNLMVLPDPERTISRVHAKVVFRNGRYALEDRGSNPITVNGNIVGHGKEWPLAPGDTILIGGYEIAVRAGDAPAKASDPFDDIFGEPASVPMAPAPAVAPPRPAPAPQPSFSPSPRPPAGHIPSGWNPLADETGGGSLDGLVPGQRSDAASASVAPAEDSIDDLFGLGEGANKGKQVWAEDDDFLGVFDPGGPASGGVGEPAVKPRHEDRSFEHARSDLGAAFPNAVPAAPPAAKPPPAPSRTPPELASKSPVTGGKAVRSWDGGQTRETMVVAPPGAGRRTGQRGPAPAMRTTPPPVAAPAVAAAPAAGHDELLRAFLEGLGAVHAPPVQAITPELMRLVGALLAEAVGGAVELLQARASVKREVRADVTAIRPRANNPLKFSPTAALALQHMLGPKAPGFLGPEAAMKDAFRDLRAHELAVMAGMRSALGGLLQRFAPENLESRIAARSGLSALLAGGRKAQLWEAFTSLYSQLSAEAEDDFHQVFGKAFVEAYQDQLERLSGEHMRGG